MGIDAIIYGDHDLKLENIREGLAELERRLGEEIILWDMAGTDKEPDHKYNIGYRGDWHKWKYYSGPPTDDPLEAWFLDGSLDLAKGGDVIFSLYSKCYGLWNGKRSSHLWDLYFTVSFTGAEKYRDQFGGMREKFVKWGKLLGGTRLVYLDDNNFQGTQELIWGGASLDEFIEQMKKEYGLPISRIEEYWDLRNQWKKHFEKPFKYPYSEPQKMWYIDYF